MMLIEDLMCVKISLFLFCLHMLCSASMGKTHRQKFELDVLRVGSVFGEAALSGDSRRAVVQMERTQLSRRRPHALQTRLCAERLSGDPRSGKNKSRNSSVFYIKTLVYVTLCTVRICTFL